MVCARLRRSMSAGPPPRDISCSARATIEVTARFATSARITITQTRIAVVAAHDPKRSLSSVTGRSTPTNARAGKTSASIATTKASNRTSVIGAFWMRWGSAACVRPSTEASSRRTSPPAISEMAKARTAANVTAARISSV
jgi:hypothetical protein